VANFRVTNIVDGDTFDVSPGWRWEGQTGNRVRPTGFDAPEMGTFAGDQAKQKLARILYGQTVEIGSAHRVDRGRLVCDVFYQGKKLAEYFPEYQ
jgi:endonuclease YncB( thermonuclease family)